MYLRRCPSVRQVFQPLHSDISQIVRRCCGISQLRANLFQEIRRAAWSRGHAPSPGAYVLTVHGRLEAARIRETARAQQTGTLDTILSDLQDRLANVSDELHIGVPSWVNYRLGRGRRSSPYVSWLHERAGISCPYPAFIQARRLSE